MEALRGTGEDEDGGGDSEEEEAVAVVDPGFPPGTGEERRERQGKEEKKEEEEWGGRIAVFTSPKKPALALVFPALWIQFLFLSLSLSLSPSVACPRSVPSRSSLQPRCHTPADILTGTLTDALRAACENSVVRQLHSNPNCATCSRTGMEKERGKS